MTLKSWLMFWSSLQLIIIVIIIIGFYIALYTPKGHLTALPTLLPLVTGPFISSLKPSQLPGEYTACAAKCSAPSLINHKNHLCPHRYPFYPWWREAFIVMCLAQGHKCHDWDLNPHSAEQKHQSLSSVF